MRRVIVTRAAREAQQWVQDLRARGIEALALPLIEIGPVREPAQRAAVAAMARTLAGSPASPPLVPFDALMFVSANAVRGLVQALDDLGEGRAAAWLTQAAAGGRPRLWAPGPGTVAALRAAGADAALIDAPAADAGQFDSEALWAAVMAREQQLHGPLARLEGRRVLIVRGAGEDSAETGGDSGPGDAGAGAGAGSTGTAGSGRDWLMQRLREAGAHAQALTVYARQRPQFSEADRALWRERAQGVLWLFSSSEAVRHLPDGVAEPAAPALATHERIAAAAMARGFTVRVCRPTLDEVVRSIESLDA